jgi:hypothetical protein
MRHFRMTFRLGAAVCASATIGALIVTSAPAMAAEFTSSRLPNPCSVAEPCKTKGLGVLEAIEEKHEGFSQEFKFGPIKVVCAKATTFGNTPEQGAVTWSTSQTFTTEVKFAKCLTVIRAGTALAGLPTTFNHGKPVLLTYHANGEVDIGETEGTFKVAAKLCKVNLPEQTITKHAAEPYSTTDVNLEGLKAKKFPSGIQERLSILNELRGIEYEYEEGQCVGEGGFEKEFKVKGNDGTYLGGLEARIGAGNLGFTP